MSDAFASNVSGESVRLDLPEAGIASRLLALTIDLTLLLILLVGAVLASGLASSALDTAASAAIVLVLTLLVILGVPVSVETLTSGKSVGKYTMGLRVITDTGSPVRFRHAILRGLFMVLIDLWTTAGAVGLLTSLANTRGKRVGDFFAGTVVVRDRFTINTAAAVQSEVVPIPWVAWAQTVDTRKLQQSTVAEAINFLPRRHELAPEIRKSTAQALADQYAADLGWPPPAQSDVELFLLAITHQAAAVL
jgi:uncharacterized RDD family membrane protein YckC